MHSSLPWNLCGEQVGFGSRNRLSSAVETSRDCVVGPSRCLADDQVQHWTAIVARISGGSSASRTTAATASLVEQCALQAECVFSSRVEPRWELGAWVGKMELTNERQLGTLAGIRSSRTIYRLTKSHCHSKDALDRIARRCGQGSTSQETVHHAEIG